jgi:hypothetical protein
MLRGRVPLTAGTLGIVVPPTLVAHRIRNRVALAGTPAVIIGEFLRQFLRHVNSKDRHRIPAAATDGNS